MCIAVAFVQRREIDAGGCTLTFGVLGVSRAEIPMPGSINHQRVEDSTH